mgnify:CR=1 FL=1
MARFLNSEGNLLMDLNFSLSETYTGKLWIDGKKIYEKTINIGTLPNNGNSGVKNVAHGISCLLYTSPSPRDTR